MGKTGRMEDGGGELEILPCKSSEAEATVKNQRLQQEGETAPKIAVSDPSWRKTKSFSLPAPLPSLCFSRVTLALDVEQ